MPALNSYDLFPRERKPRAKPRKLMHICDAAGDCGDQDTGAVVRMQCPRCGHITDWVTFDRVTDAKRGMPCPRCNPELAEG